MWEWVWTWPFGLGAGYYGAGAVLNYMNKRGFKGNGVQV